MKRIYSLDLIKLFFAYVIALSHFGIEITPGANVTVQFFFLISGFFLAKKFYSRSFNDHGNSYNQWNYTLDHIRSLFPHYLLSLLILTCHDFVTYILSFLRQPNLTSAAQAARFLYERIPELVLLQNSGVFEGGINYPLWQVSTLVISGYFIYGLLCANEKLSRQILFPACVLMIQTYLKTSVDIWGIAGCFYIPLLRAFSPMCIGVILFHITQTDTYERFKAHHNFFDAATVFSFAAIFSFRDYQEIFLLLGSIILLTLYNPDSFINALLNKKIFRQFGEFSYAIYLNHAFIIIILQHYLFPIAENMFAVSIPPVVQSILYVITLTLYSICTLALTKKLTGIARKHFSST